MFFPRAIVRGDDSAAKASELRISLRYTFSRRLFGISMPMAALPGMGGYDANGVGPQGKGQVIRQTGDLADFHARRGFVFIHGDDRSRRNLRNAPLHVEVEEFSSPAAWSSSINSPAESWSPAGGGSSSRLNGGDSYLPSGALRSNKVCCSNAFFFSFFVSTGGGGLVDHCLLFPDFFLMFVAHPGLYFTRLMFLDTLGNRSAYDFQAHPRGPRRRSPGKGWCR